MQQGIVYHSQLAPGAGVYIQQLVVDLHEELDVLYFHEAWRRVIERHGALRTHFVLDDPDALLQEVKQAAMTRLDQVDWADLPEEEQQERWRRHLHEDRRQGFDLTQSPLLLSHYSGQEDVVFGATRECRMSSVVGAASTVGLFINTIPFRARIPKRASVLSWLEQLRSDWMAMRPHEHTPLVDVQRWSGLPDHPICEWSRRSLKGSVPNGTSLSVTL
jgi:hypothetical protein